MKQTIIKVTENNDLVKYLTKNSYSKNKIKTYIKLGFIYINDKQIKKLPQKVLVNDIITIKKEPIINTKLEILYEDNNYLIVNKKEGLLTISTGKENKKSEPTLYKEVRKYLNSKKEYAFTVNRLDKDTSGIVIFVKNELLKEKLQNNWNNIVKKRGYIAIVSGIINKSGRIENYLYEDKLTFTHSTKIGGKLAITNYKPIKHNKLYTMLDINIETGRKNQIRVHMSEMNHPIIGDKKYKCIDNPLHRLGLHHYEISFIDPISNKIIKINKESPKEFNDLFINH